MSQLCDGACRMTRSEVFAEFVVWQGTLSPSLRHCLLFHLYTLLRVTFSNSPSLSIFSS